VTEGLERLAYDAWKQMMSSARESDLRTAALLCALSVAWNVVAGTGSVIVGILTHSLTLVSFGLNAAVDSLASATLVWRFGAERRDESRADTVERKTLWVVAVTLLAIAVYIGARSVIALASRDEPESSAFGVGLAVASLFVLTPLAIRKGQLARLLASQALRGDSVLSGVGAALAFLALAGQGLVAVLHWWWADAIGALLMSVILLREARAAFQAARGMIVSR
jgi:divalent metal cation (Fe/Co/Zn/Cd) transporter